MQNTALDLTDANKISFFWA